MKVHRHVQRRQFADVRRWTGNLIVVLAVFGFSVRYRLINTAVKWTWRTSRILFHQKCRSEAVYPRWTSRLSVSIQTFENFSKNFHFFCSSNSSITTRERNGNSNCWEFWMYLSSETIRGLACSFGSESEWIEWASSEPLSFGQLIPNLNSCEAPSFVDSLSSSSLIAKWSNLQQWSYSTFWPFPSQQLYWKFALKFATESATEFSCDWF